MSTARSVSATLLLWVSVSSLLGCSGSSSTSQTLTPPQMVSIAISPTSSSVQTALTLQFTATVSGTTNTAATWQVNGITGGAASTGTVSSSGLYTAPATVPSPSTVTVSAISAADTTKTASAVVTITAPPVSVSVSPTSTSVETLHTQQFTATVSNASNTSVVWSVNGTTGGSSTVGTVTTGGLYTAPSSVPTPAAVTVTATSAQDSTKSASAQVTVQAPPVPTGTWSYIGPSGASGTAQLVADPQNAQTIYLSTYWGGVYKSTNGGAAWTVLVQPTGFESWIIVNPTTERLFLFGQSSFQTSANGGQTFGSPITYPGGFSGGSTPFTVAVDPSNDQTLYFLSGTSLMRSQNGGSTWTALTLPPNVSIAVSQSGTQLSLGRLIVSAANSSVLMATATNGFDISQDGGVTWQTQTTGLNPSFSYLRQIVQDRNSPSRALALGSYSASSGTSPNAYIYISTNSGSTWTSVMEVGVYDRMPQDQTGPGIYAFSNNSFVATFDNGTTIKTLSPTIDPTGYGAVISPLLPSLIVYQGFNDFFISQDGGTTWTISETNVDSYQLGPVVYAGSIGPLYVAAPPNNFATSEMWQSTTSGASWTRTLNARSTVPFYDFDVDPTNPLHLIAVEAYSGYAYSASSMDGGNTWAQTPYATGMYGGFLPYKYAAVRFGAPGSNLVFACGTFGAARLSTTTNTWTIINNGLPSGVSCTALGIDMATPGTIYATTGSGVYKSTDSGNDWLLFTSGNNYVSILVDPGNSNNIFLSASGGGSGARTIDGGKTWSSMTVGGVMAFNPSNKATIWAVSGNFVQVSYDSGLTWGHITAPTTAIEDLAVLPTGSVVFTTDTSSVIEFTPQ